MYKIITPNGDSFLTEKPNFIRVHSNNCFILTEQSKAEGVAHHGTPYLFNNGAICYEVDGGDVYKDIEEVNNITFVTLAETKVLDDDTAARHARVFEEWREGVYYEVGKMRRCPRTGKLYRVREGQAHTSVAGWEPSLTPAMWVVVDVTHAGTTEDPIPADRGMEYVYGLYYTDPEDGKLYICKRQGEPDGGKIVLQFLPHELIGQYFELVAADG